MISAEETDRFVASLSDFTSWYLTVRTGLEWVVSHKIEHLDFEIHCSFGNYHRRISGDITVSMNEYYKNIISNCEPVIQDRLRVTN